MPIGLVGHHLQKFAFRADSAVGRVGRIGAEREKHARDRKREDDEQQVAANEKDRAGDDHEREKAEHVQVLEPVDHIAPLFEQLEYIIERLEKRRALARLHASGDDTVEPGEQSAGHGREQDKAGAPEQFFKKQGGVHNKLSFITPAA
jgi:hypothetical protein